MFFFSFFDLEFYGLPWPLMSGSSDFAWVIILLTYIFFLLTKLDHI